MYVYVRELISACVCVRASMLVFNLLIHCKLYFRATSLKISTTVDSSYATSI